MSWFNKHKKIPEKTENVIDAMLKIVFVLIMLMGIYVVFDKLYVYSLTDRNSILYSLNAQAAEEEITAYEDAAAWLYIPGIIKEPVMHGLDNVEYLNKGPDGKYSLRGSIFMDSRNSGDFSDDYTLLYGHHMSFYQMFGALDYYFDEAYWTEEYLHGYILMSSDFEDAQAEKLSFTIVAMGSIDASVEEVFAATETNIEDIKSFLVDSSNFEISNINNISELDGKRIMCLSTCQTPDSTLRTCVICVFDD